MNDEKLDGSLLEEIENYAVVIAQQAGQILWEQFRKPLEIQFKDKEHADPVTSADRLSDDYLKRAIRQKFPQHNILSEEGASSSESDSPFIWVLDPLDGTANYLNGLPLFAVSIGVLWKRQPVVGSIYVPVSQRGAQGVYRARLGWGAFLNNERIGVVTQPSSRPLSEIPVQFGEHLRLAGQSRKEYPEARNLGSIALEITLAAGGVFQYAFFGGPRIWDVAAGVLLVKEAGGLSLIRLPQGKDWQKLERFQMESDNASEPLENLRRWSFPLVLGAAERTRKIVKDIRFRHNPLSGLAARFWTRNNYPNQPIRK
jgi:myo-inositol-1(or 4)-monophosphatase